MISVQDMHLAKATKAIEELQKLVEARGALSRAINSALDGRYGPQGVSSNTRFYSEVMRMFDEHVDHLARQELSRLDAALFVERTTEPKDAMGAEPSSASQSHD